MSEDKQNNEAEEADEALEERHRQDRGHSKRKAKSGAKGRRAAGSKVDGIHRRRSRRISW